MTNGDFGIEVIKKAFRLSPRDRVYVLVERFNQEGLIMGREKHEFKMPAETPPPDAGGVMGDVGHLPGDVTMDVGQKIGFKPICEPGCDHTTHYGENEE